MDGLTRRGQRPWRRRCSMFPAGEPSDVEGRQGVGQGRGPRLRSNVENMNESNGSHSSALSDIQIWRPMWLRLSGFGSAGAAACSHSRTCPSASASGASIDLRHDWGSAGLWSHGAHSSLLLALRGLPWRGADVAEPAYPSTCSPGPRVPRDCGVTSLSQDQGDR
jgi:hypothetical protein